ncbi:ABC transporter permease [Streptococcus porcinus]|uniref:ABC transporter permease n=1 Tax=Streptococcus porcinus TaxID=1340 RepID=A0A7V9WRI4_STRPO|nr:ABC transporter permease [Streptococcus porcinus]MBA2795518.1 ABC transporter permease [Streptococcus porcinus]
MLRLIIYQYRKSRKQWLGTIPVFGVSAMIVSLSLNGLFAIVSNSDSFSGTVDPKPIFLMPIFFGGLTLFLVVASIIRFLIDLFKDDYRLWAIIGADRCYLSFIIAGQLFIVAFFSSCLSYPISLILTSQYYLTLQHLFGLQVLPNINISASIPAFLLTLFIIPMLAFFSGLFYSGKILKISENNKRVINNKFRVSVRKFILLIFIFLLLWGVCLTLIFDLPNINYGVPKIFVQVQAIFYTLIINILFINSITPYLQTFILNIIKVLVEKFGYGFIIARWNILKNQSYLKSLNVSLITGITLISGFQLISNNILFLFQRNSAIEMKASFVLYLMAPILIILSNVISLTILVSTRNAKEKNTMSILGVSSYHYITIQLCEALLNSVLIYIISITFNIVILALICYVVGNQLHIHLVDYMSALSIAAYVAIITFIVIFLTKILQQRIHS